MSDDPTAVEGAGETVGEARWAATRELERRYPGLDKETIEFQVLSEGERGLMGVGREPARVLAQLTVVPATDPVAPVRTPQREERRAPRQRTSAPVLPAATGPLAERIEEVMTAICGGIGLEATVSVGQGPYGLVANVEGDDLGLLIGKHGHLYRMGDGIALEPQKFPDAPNQPSFVSARVDPGKPYRHIMVLRMVTAKR